MIFSRLTSRSRAAHPCCGVPLVMATVVAYRWLVRAVGMAIPAALEPAVVTSFHVIHNGFPQCEMPSPLIPWLKTCAFFLGTQILLAPPGHSEKNQKSLSVLSAPTCHWKLICLPLLTPECSIPTCLVAWPSLSPGVLILVSMWREK